MRKFKESPSGFEVDLDDPATYKHLPNTKEELRNLMFREIGYAIIYMDYLPKSKYVFPKRKKKDEFVKLSEFSDKWKDSDRMMEINNCGYNQRQRVYKLMKNFAENERDHRYTEDEKKDQENLMWYKEQVFLFQDEIENMC